MPMPAEIITTAGRDLEVWRSGPADAMPLVFHIGTPMAVAEFPALADLAAARGLQTVIYSRPGYGRSTRRQQHAVAAVAEEVGSILEWLGVKRFVTVGWSGGGPRAIACAALLPDRCLAAASVGGVAPYGPRDLDWLSGMTAGNIAEYTAALAGPQALEAYLGTAARDVASLQPDAVFGWLARDATPKDAPLAAPFAEWVATSFRRSQASGLWGWLDDDLAEIHDWGFDLAKIRRPVSIWHGNKDTSVPIAHGRWLADHIPHAQPHLFEEHGHFSLPVVLLGTILDELLAARDGPVRRHDVDPRLTG